MNLVLNLGIIISHKQTIIMEQYAFPFPTSMPGAKNTGIIQTYRGQLLDKAKLLNVHTVHIFNKLYPKGGLTVAFRKVSEYKSGKMVECAVATCSDQDIFSKKTGTTIALEKFFDGNTIELPLLAYYDLCDMNHVVKRAFTALYKSH